MLFTFNLPGYELKSFNDRRKNQVNESAASSIAFDRNQRIAIGPLPKVALKAKETFDAQAHLQQLAEPAFQMAIEVARQETRHA
jgi:cation transport regulator ChaB